MPPRRRDRGHGPFLPCQPPGPSWVWFLPRTRGVRATPPRSPPARPFPGHVAGLKVTHVPWIRCSAVRSRHAAAWRLRSATAAAPRSFGAHTSRQIPPAPWYAAAAAGLWYVPVPGPGRHGQARLRVCTKVHLRLIAGVRLEAPSPPAAPALGLPGVGTTHLSVALGIEARGPTDRRGRASPGAPSAGLPGSEGVDRRRVRGVAL